MSEEQNPGLPGLCGTDHIGFTVPNLEEAIRFFVDVIGCEMFYSLGEVKADDRFKVDDNWMTQNLNVHPHAVIKDIRLLRCRNGSNFEIFEYSSPDQNTHQPKNSDIGGHHLAFYVDDIWAAADYLRSKGVKLLGEPKPKTEGPSAGEAWLYFLAPWGMQLELVSYPNGKAYEKEYEGRLWHSKYPAN